MTKRTKKLDRNVEDVNLGRWILGGLLADRDDSGTRYPEMEPDERRAHQALIDEAVATIKALMDEEA